MKAKQLTNAKKKFNDGPANATRPSMEKKPVMTGGEVDMAQGHRKLSGSLLAECCNYGEDGEMSNEDGMNEMQANPQLQGALPPSKPSKPKRKGGY